MGEAHDSVFEDTPLVPPHDRSSALEADGEYGGNPEFLVGEGEGDAAYPYACCG